MHLRTGVAARLARRVARQVETPLLDLPVFLCPALSPSPLNLSLQVPQRRLVHSAAEQISSIPQNDTNIQQMRNELREASLIKKLPPQCSGCGALSQTVDKNEPGFFDLVRQRKSVKKYLAGTTEATKSMEDRIFEQAIEQAKENDLNYADTLDLHFTPTSKN
jgi:hypothetical protein